MVTELIFTSPIWLIISDFGLINLYKRIMKHLDKNFINKVYDILVSLGGANERDRGGFIYHHCESDDGCNEWRFCGKFGMSGKWWSRTNLVSSDTRDDLREEMNNELNLIKQQS